MSTCMHRSNPWDECYACHVKSLNRVKCKEITDTDMLEYMIKTGNSIVNRGAAQYRVWHEDKGPVSEYFSSARDAIKDAMKESK